MVTLKSNPVNGRDDTTSYSCNFLFHFCHDRAGPKTPVEVKGCVNFTGDVFRQSTSKESCEQFVTYTPTVGADAIELVGA